MHGYIVLCLLTGVRSEEARALTWQHVDLDAGTISVWRSVGAHGDTKTNRSRRTLKMSASDDRVWWAGPTMRTGTSEPRYRASWTLAAAVHQAVMDHGTWSSRGRNPHAYPPIWAQTGSIAVVAGGAPKGRSATLAGQLTLAGPALAGGDLAGPGGGLAGAGHRGVLGLRWSWRGGRLPWWSRALVSSRLGLPRARGRARGLASGSSG